MSGYSFSDVLNLPFLPCGLRRPVLHGDGLFGTSTLDPSDFEKAAFFITETAKGAARGETQQAREWWGEFKAGRAHLYVVTEGAIDLTVEERFRSRPEFPVFHIDAVNGGFWGGFSAIDIGHIRAAKESIREDRSVPSGDLSKHEKEAKGWQTMLSDATFAGMVASYEERNYDDWTEDFRLQRDSWGRTEDFRLQRDSWGQSQRVAGSGWSWSR